jgi:multicomponent Na+:H+ antiporter subunit E
MGMREWFRRGAPRAAGFVVLWGILTDGNPSSWGVGVPVIVAATMVSVTLLPQYSWRWRLLGLVRFVPFFFWQSLRSGIDVARRALSLRLPLNPRLLDYPLRLSDGPARVFFANAASLLPGTVSVEIQEARLIVHALDGDASILDELRSLEEAVAALFGADMSAAAVRGGSFGA